MTTGADGTTSTSADGRVALGPSRPSFEVQGEPAGARDLVVELGSTALPDAQAEVRGRLVNRGTRPVAVERFTLVHISALRRKIDAPFGTDTIRTIRGAGYQLAGQ